MASQPDFADWLAICNVKADYCRLLDTKQWAEWAQVFTEDVVVDVPEAGTPPTTSRDDFVWPLSKMLAEVKTAHQVHSPQIAIEGDKAKVIWAMQDRLHWPDGNTMTGYGHYHEEYRRTADGWKIANLRLSRLILEK
jgi:ketosteroid isomerase-like protein